VYIQNFFFYSFSNKETTLKMTCFYEVSKVDTTSGSSTDYKPLPSTVTDFIAEIVCGILETHQQPGFTWDFIPLPELLFFINKVTEKAKVDVQTAIASMVLVSRLKKRLPKTGWRIWNISQDFLGLVVGCFKGIHTSNKRGGNNR